ncbi:LytTR family DNA-binding domain-containing protein [Levilactobacillus parabrevis]|uniref:LytTR family DNA-binding domain-containing protein n=1 Tax=Levilactobacillus parabrevis TaxID=357278 RepID=UPI0021A6F586|nr:LytTR family DNA-binding domain-containing protein [Levilactobacillus parabrevis]MCT4487894.1 LytTR family transcriptional regulator [Levilactobacillus parabrevis]MCT4491240.1 LytTR family transcriptional regulator [Levilactobacillus parabrevis]
MRHKFEKNSEIDPADPVVVVQAASETGAVPDLLAYLDRYAATQPGMIAVKTPDRLVMVKVATIISAEIQTATLLLYTTSGVVTTKEPLRHLLQRLANPNFVQVSKHSVLNLDHLQSLEDSFSGSMTATLTAKVKTDVSRKYVKGLMQRLGI